MFYKNLPEKTCNMKFEILDFDIGTYTNKDGNKK